MIEIGTANGTTESEQVIVKTSGWIKYQKDGEIHHLPPHRVQSLHERDPTEKETMGDEPYYSSDVVYQSPHGQV